MAPGQLLDDSLSEMFVNDRIMQWVTSHIWIIVVISAIVRYTLYMDRSV